MKFEYGAAGEEKASGWDVNNVVKEKVSGCTVNKVGAYSY